MGVIASLMMKAGNSEPMPLAVALLRHCALIATNEPADLLAQLQILETEFAQTPLGRTAEFRELLEELEKLSQLPSPDR
ncbi:MAG: hypothetical protein RIS70_2658 [Planctomycetota bacterium]|jgi:hypothetical protein